MSDIVEQLRYYAKATYTPVDVFTKAADEIERLRERLEFSEWEWNRATEALMAATKKANND